MNILIVHNYYKIPGGEDTVVENEKKLLESHGHNVTLYTRSNCELDSFSKLQKLGLIFTTIYNPKTIREITDILNDKSIDIIHVHNTLNLVSPSVYYVAKKAHIPVVQTLHNFRLQCMGACFYRDGKICEDCISYGNKCALKYKCYRNSFIQTLACTLNNWFHRTTKIYAKLNYICLTQFNKDKLLLWKHKGNPIVKEENIYIKPNFTYEPDQSTIIKDSSDEYYLFMGRIETIKGIDTIIKAFDKTPDKMLKIAGTGNEFEYWQKYVSEHNLSNIQLLGYQKKQDLLPLLKNAKALIVASKWYETFGMVVAESYSVGTPVIAGDIGNIGDIVEDNITGVKFKYNDIDDLVHSINRFEQLDRPFLSKNAYNKYLNYFSDEINYKMLITIYESILTKQKRKR